MSRKKRCSRCLLKYPLENFHKNKSSADGLNHRCKPCNSKHVLHHLKNRTYSSYRCARERCNNTRHKSYAYYGGRGIKFKFKSWREIESEIGPRPAGMELDRIDTNKDYEPGNIQWRTRRQQMRNTRANIFTEQAADEIRKLSRSGWRVCEIASRFAVRATRVSEIIQGKTWVVENE